jgi:TatD DNase family protein
MIDTHCHLTMKEFDADREDVVRRTLECGIEAVITVGSDFAQSAEAVRLAERYDSVYAAVGIHPHDAKDCSDAALGTIRQWTEEAKVIAIGETGLDYHYDHSPRDVQQDVFVRHLLLARETGLPVIVHSREAKSDTLRILRGSGLNRGVLHCFSGDRDMAEQAMAMGFSISFAGPVTFKKTQDLKELARLVPDDFILVETDAPYLSPEPLRGKRNEPCHMVHTLRHIAELRGISPTDLARITTLNARRLFGIGTIPDTAAIAYQIRDALYLNITNRCTNSCSFCMKFRSDYVKGHYLKLDREPTGDEIKKAIGDPSRYREIVFCGYGEPLQRLQTVKDVAGWIKERGGSVRINTNGHGNIIHRRDILPELQGIVDSMSISLDAHDDETYERICKPLFKNAFHEVLRFVEQARDHIPSVRVTVVDLEGVDLEKCRLLAERLGVELRIRKLDAVG